MHDSFIDGTGGASALLTVVAPPATPRERLLIWGAGGHAKVVAEIARLSGRLQVSAFIDELDPTRANEPFCGATVRGLQAFASARRDGITAAVVAIGDCQARLERALRLATAGYRLVTLIHPTAIVAEDVTIGDGTVIAAGAILSPAVMIGRAVIINTGAIIDHECAIADGAHVSPGARLAGGVRVGGGAWVGIGATVIDKVRIGEGAIVGAGSVVLRDVPPHVVVHGIPAKYSRNTR
jgi:sugar O-acyltransferase (sialic acid O-acetyltransferase NeuD family)